jgi:trehalose/maltose transport system permease protein
MADSATGVATPSRPGRSPTKGLWGGVRSELADKDRRLAYYLVAPSLLIILLIAVFPVVYAIYLSFQDVIPNQPATWAGFSNYVELFGDEDFGRALLNTFTFTVASVGLEVVLGMGIALALNRVFAGRGVTRATTLAPWALPPAVAAIMWRLMFQDQIGILSYIASTLKIYTGTILGSEGAILIGAIAADVWKTTPFMALLILAGLQVIPEDVYEAARVDGATAAQQFWRVTLPLVKPALLVALLFRTLDAWRVYDLFWVMGNRQLDSLSVFVYNGVKISQLDFSVGNAAAVFIFLSSIAIAFFFFKVLGAQPKE